MLIIEYLLMWQVLVISQIQNNARLKKKKKNSYLVFQSVTTFTRASYQYNKCYMLAV